MRSGWDRSRSNNSTRRPARPWAAARAQPAMPAPTTTRSQVWCVFVWDGKRGWIFGVVATFIAGQRPGRVEPAVGRSRPSLVLPAANQPRTAPGPTRGASTRGLVLQQARGARVPEGGGGRFARAGGRLSRRRGATARTVHSRPAPLPPGLPAPPHRRRRAACFTGLAHATARQRSRTSGSADTSSCDGTAGSTTASSRSAIEGRVVCVCCVRRGAKRVGLGRCHTHGALSFFRFGKCGVFFFFFVATIRAHRPKPPLCPCLQTPTSSCKTPWWPPKFSNTSSPRRRPSSGEAVWWVGRLLSGRFAVPPGPPRISAPTAPPAVPRALVPSLVAHAAPTLRRKRRGLGGRERAAQFFFQPLARVASKKRLTLPVPPPSSLSSYVPLVGSSSAPVKKEPTPKKVRGAWG